MTGISTLGQALDQIERVKQQQAAFADLSLQLTSGKKTPIFAGLGSDVLTSQRARADIKSIDTYVSNIINGDRRIKIATSAIATFKKHAQDFASALVGFKQQGTHQLGEKVYDGSTPLPGIEVGSTSASPDTELRTLQNIASSIFSAVSSLLNTQDGDTYVFGGAESTLKPFEDKGTLDSALSAQIAAWKAGTITTNGLIADLSDRIATGGNADALTDTIVGYNAPLSANAAGKTYVRISQTTQVDYTALANDSSFRDIMVAAACVKNATLGPVVDVYASTDAYPSVPVTQGAPGSTVQEMKENFYKVLNTLSASVNKAIDGLDALSAKLANAGVRINQVKDDHIVDKTILENTVSDIEDADPNVVAVKLTNLQTRIEASFRITALTQQLSLANYISFT